MKKLLAFTSVFAIAGTSTSTVISCNNIANFEYYTSKIMDNIVDQKVTDENNVQYDMSNYFEKSLKKWNISPKNDDKLTGKLFSQAIDASIESIVSNSNSEKQKDYTYKLVAFDEINSKTNPSKEIKDSELEKNTQLLSVLLKDWNAFFIQIDATKDSDKWAGHTKPSQESIFTMKEKGDNK